MFLIHAPLGRAHAPDAVTPLDVRIVRERMRSLGWREEVLGTARGLAAEEGYVGP